MSYHDAKRYPDYNTPAIVAALQEHGLEVGTPSQLSDAFRFGFRAALASAPAAARKATDEEIRQWAERHDIHESAPTLRAIFEDAQTLTGAPTSAPLPLTDDELRSTALRHAREYPKLRHLVPFEAELVPFVRSIARECLAAAPVAWMREDGDVVSAALKHSMENHQGLPGKRMAVNYTIPLGRIGAALSGGSPEPVSGSEALDAKRYRWLRDHAGSYESGIYEDNGFGGQSLKYAEDLDGAIDAALSTERTSERGQA